MGLSILPVEIVSAAEHTNVEAINVNMAVSRADKIDYVYRIINGKLYKKLYNFTEGNGLAIGSFANSLPCFHY